MMRHETILRQAAERAAGGDQSGACELLQQLLDIPDMPPNHLLPAAFQAFQSGNIDLAERLLRRSTELAPDFAPAYTNLGNVLQEQGRLHEAISVTKKAVDLAPQNPMNHVNLGSLQETNQRPDLAESAFRNALAIAPDDPSVMDALGRILLKLARPSEAEKYLNNALQIEPRLVSAHLNLGTMHENAGQFEAAAAAYEIVLQLAPNDFAAQSNLAQVHLLQGRRTEAEAGFRSAMKISPNDPIAFNNLAQLLLQNGNFQASIAASDGALSADPGNRNALANKYFALNELGEDSAARDLLDLDGFVSAPPIQPPSGYEDLAAFNEALFKEVDGAPDRFSEPGHALARQTLDLMLEPGPAVTAYGEIIDTAVSDYIAALPADPNHPFIASKPESWRLEAWGTITRELVAGEDSHIHPGAWLSGVYYTRLPNSVRNEENTDGYLEIGRPPNHLPQNVAPELRIIQPKAGLLVLFPSYTYHRILPFSSKETRMSVAFDAVPV